MNSDFTRKIAASQNLRQGGKNPIESDNNADEPKLSETDNLERQTIQDNTGKAQGFQTVVQGGTAYVGEIHIHNATTGNTSPNDLSVQFWVNPLLPENVISLSIHKTDSFQYNIRAYYRDSEKIEPIDLVLLIAEVSPLLDDHARVFESNQLPVNLYGELDRHNNRLLEVQSISQLLEWLLKWDKFGSEDAILEIYDYKQLDISWESIEIDREIDRMPLPLGVTIQIVRKYTESIFSSKLGYSKHYCEGRILAHTTSKTCLWQRKYRHNCFSIFQEFINHLSRTTSKYGLILIDGFRSECLIQRDPTSSIKFSKLLEKQASVVLISGQLNFYTFQLKHQELLKLFYTCGAKGVIGTLRLVEGTIAGKVMENFFDLLEQQREDSRLTGPAMLRTMRRDAYDLLRDDPDNDLICSLYLATFQYIYYGNPFTTLQLTRVNN
jgi:hypothetical protein